MAFIIPSLVATFHRGLTKAIVFSMFLDQAFSRVRFREVVLEPSPGVAGWGKVEMWNIRMIEDGRWEVIFWIK